MTQPKSMIEPTQHFPKGPLIAAAGVIVITICAAATASLTGIGKVRMADTQAARVLDLRFADRIDGGIEVMDANSQRMVDVLPPGGSGFVRTVMRSLVRERRLHEQGRQTPFQLIRWADGRMSVEDPATGRRIDLGAFGAPNRAAFARLMIAGESTQ